MQILDTIIHQTVWGGSKLAKYCGSSTGNIGHLYSCIDTVNMNSPIIWGSYKDRTIHEWFINNRQRYGLEKFKRLPVLMALVDASESLSIQVHPDDLVAAELEKLPFGKNESFYIMQAPSCGYMYNGCVAKTKESFLQKINQGACLEMVDTVEVKVGDYVYVEGGTLHAATKGSLCFEIEENCDATYRFYDYGRLDCSGQLRQLQVNEALRSLDLTKKSVVKQYKPGEPIVERMYSTQLFANGGVYSNTVGEFSILVILSGELIIENMALQPGTAILLEDSDILDMGNAVCMLVKVLAH